MSKPQLKDQFRFPTVTQRHSDGLWETVIGSRIIVGTAETLMAGLLANPEVMWIDDAGNSPDMEKIAKMAASGTLLLLKEVDKHIS